MKPELKEKRISVLCFATLLLLGLIGILVRIPGLDHLSGDMIDCYLPWYESVPAHQGIGVLRNYEGDYGLPYATVLWLLHYIPGEALIKIKMVSVVFEYVTALSAGLLASHFFEGWKKKLSFVICFGLTILYPALVMNGAYWGQCDGIYAGFVLLMIWALFKDRPALAFVFLGFAVTSKLQTIFIIPFLILYWYRRRNFSLLYFLIVPAVVEILYIPGMLAGYSPLAPVTMYLAQTVEYPQMYMHYPGLWCYFWSLADYEMFHVPVIGWVAAGLALVFVMLMLKGKDLSDRTWISVALWSSLFPVYFLPAMHERYSMIAELIAVIYAVLHPKRSWTSAFLWLTISWAVYQPMIMDRFPEQEKTALGMIFVVIALTVFMIRDVMEDKVRDSEAGSVKTGHITRFELKFLDCFDRYGMWPVLFVVLAIFVYSGYKAISYAPMMILEDVQANLALLRTPVYRLCESPVVFFGSVFGMTPDVSVKAFGVFAAGAAAVLWGYVAFPGNKEALEDILVKRILFMIAFLLMPGIVFYPLILGSADGICLLLCGVGMMFLNGSRDKGRGAAFAISCAAFSLALSIMPGYLIFLGMFALMAVSECQDMIRKYISAIVISAFISFLTILTGPLSGMSIRDGLLSFGHGFILQGAVWVPLSVILLLMCIRDRRYILSLLAFEFALTLGFGKYIGSVKVKYYIFIPLMIMGCLANVMFTAYMRHKKQNAGL